MVFLVRGHSACKCGLECEQCHREKRAQESVVVLFLFLFSVLANEIVSCGHLQHIKVILKNKTFKKLKEYDNTRNTRKEALAHE